MKVSVVIPAWNEGESVAGVVARLRETLESERITCEIIVVNDGSADNTAEEARRAGAVVVSNPSNKGYGYSLLRGIEAASHPLIAITDADETYPSEALPEMLRKCETFDMVIGQRTGQFYQGSKLKSLSRVMFRLLAEFTSGSTIPDINSGLRVFRRDFVLKHRKSISTGYSFTTTITLIALLEGMHLLYIPIAYHRRTGESKVRYLRDTLRSLQIITEVILTYNPLKFFMLLAVLPLVLSVFQILIGVLVWKGWLSQIAWTISGTLYSAGISAVIIFTLGCLAARRTRAGD